MTTFYHDHVKALLDSLFGPFFAAGHAGFVEVRIIGPAVAQARFFSAVEQVR